MRIENWKEFERDCYLLGYDVFAAETEAQLQYGDDAWDDTIDYTDADGVRVYMEKVKPAYYNVMRGGEIVRDVPEDELTADDWDNEEFYPEETAEAVFHYDNIISRLESATLQTFGVYINNLQIADSSQANQVSQFSDA